MRRLTTFLAGAGTAYLLDPVRGRRRRHVLRDRVGRLVRRATRATVRKQRYASGYLAGLVARARRLVGSHDVSTDDRTVEQRIRSDAFRDVGVPAQSIDVRVEQGLVTLRGSVEAGTLADDLIARVRKVPGVIEVAAMLRVSAGAHEERVSS